MRRASSVECRLLLRVVLAASVIAVWLVSAPATAQAATYGCHTYVDFVWQADDWAHQSSVGQSYSYTFASAASDPNDACYYTYGYAVRAGTWQEVWTGSAWQYCSAGNSAISTNGAVMSPITTCQDMPGSGNRSYSWHTAWFAGNPWSDVTPWLYN